MNLNDLYSQPQRLQQPVAFKLVENRQDRRRMLSEARQAHSQLMENTVYRQSYTLGRLLSERLLSKDEVLQIFKAAEQGATSAGGNRTLAGQIKDKGSDVIANARDMINGAKKWVRERPTYQAVDTEYNKAMTALGKLGASNPGEANKLTQAIYKYRAIAKEYPRATGLAKWAILAATGLATGGVGAAAAIAAINAAIQDQDLVDIAAAGAGGAAGAAMVNGIPDMLPGSDAYTGPVPDAQDLGSDPAIDSDAYTGPVPDAQDLGSDPAIGATPGYNADGYPIGMDLPDETGLVNPNIKLNPETGQLYSPTGQGSTPAVADVTPTAGGTPAPTPDAQDLGSDSASTTVVDQPYKDTFDQGAGTIDYSKPGPMTYDSVGQKLEYGIPVNDKGSFIPPVDRGVPAEFAQQQAAYDAWKENYLSRYPNAQQMPDGTMSNTPNLKPLNPGQRLKLPSQTESMQWASRVRVKTLPANQLIEQKLTVMQWALNESTGRGMGSSVVLTPRAVRFVFENVGRYNRALCEYTGAPTKEFGHPTAYYAPKDALPAGKKSWFGKGLDAIGKGVDKVGKWAGNVGHNMITKVTADKLANAWNRAGENMDSDWLKDFLVRQGVPLEVVTDIWTKMSIPTGKGGYGSVTNVGGGRTMRYDAPGYGANVAPATAAGAAATSTATRLGGGKTVGTAASAPAPAARSTTAAAAPAAAKYPGEDPNGPNYVGRREVARRQAARAAAAPKPAAAGVKNLSPYSKVTYKGINPAAVGTVSGMNKAPAVPAAAPKQPKVTSGGPTADERANLQKKLQAAAAAQPVAENMADQDHAFKRGDRVYVRNQIGSDRVIRVVGDQVYLEKMGRAPMRDVSRVNPGLGQQLKTAGTDMMRGVKGFVTGRD